jgi:hypothetical protein
MRALDRARADTEHIDSWTRAIVERKEARLEAMREAVAEGATYSEIAKACGLSLARVNQILGSQGGAGGRSRVKGATAQREVSAPTGESIKVKGPKPEGHRHHYDTIGWNHTRGAYLLQQRCECGDVRVVPANRLPKELKMPADPSIRAA